MDNKEDIIFSIVTISFNNLDELKKTLSSSINQVFDRKEIIVVDGGSNDGTKEYLSSLKEPVVSYISEKDSGIYNAMNKGIQKARGIWIVFMNSGDSFYDNNVLKKVNKYISESIDILYGNCVVNYKMGYSREMMPKPIHMLWKGMSFSHQSVFARTMMMKEHPFNENYRYCSDFDFIYSMYLAKKKFQHIPIKISQIQAGGISDKKRYASAREVYKINKKNGVSLFQHIYFLCMITMSFLVVKFKDLLPKNLTLILTRLKYSNS